jgi:hypothetical protein
MATKVDAKIVLVVNMPILESAKRARRANLHQIHLARQFGQMTALVLLVHLENIRTWPKPQNITPAKRARGASSQAMPKHLV